MKEMSERERMGGDFVAHRGVLPYAVYTVHAFNDCVYSMDLRWEFYQKGWEGEGGTAAPSAYMHTCCGQGVGFIIRRAGNHRVADTQSKSGPQLQSKLITSTVSTGW